jgi:hypothetical protein
LNNAEFQSSQGRFSGWSEITQGVDSKHKALVGSKDSYTGNRSAELHVSSTCSEPASAVSEMTPFLNFEFDEELWLVGFKHDQPIDGVFANCEIECSIDVRLNGISHDKLTALHVWEQP